MTDVRRLMGRLNCASPQMGGSRGGIPELTPQDIAAALGMLRDQSDTNIKPNERPPLDELARETFCSMWWPDGARLTRRGLLALIGMRQSAELGRQMWRLAIAKLDLHIAQDGAAAKGSATSEDIQIIERLKAKLDSAKRACWPNQSNMFTVLREAVLDELARPNLCKVCGGRGSATAGELVINCQQCDGTGAAAVSDRQRAARIERDESSYRKEWRPMYEWTYNLLRDAEAQAIKAVRAALESEWA